MGITLPGIACSPNPKGDRRDNREDEEDKRERYQPERKGDDRGRVLP